MTKAFGWVSATIRRLGKRVGPGIALSGDAVPLPTPSGEERLDVRRNFGGADAGSALVDPPRASVGLSAHTVK